MEVYVRECVGLSDFGKLIPLNEIDVDKKSEKDYYRSVYYYDKKQFEEFQKTGSVAGITNVRTDKVVFDFDCKENLELARKDAVELVSRLEKLKIESNNIEIYFSGQKGFSVSFKIDKLITPKEHRTIALEKIGKDLKTLDPSMYNANRIFRVPNTKHHETPYYKVNLSVFQLRKNDLSLIYDHAKKPQNLKRNIKPITLPEDLFVPEKVEKKIINKSPLTRFDASMRPAHWKNYKWALINAHGLEQGERNKAMNVIAATCRGLGYTEDITRGFLTALDERYAQLTGQDNKPDDVELQLKWAFSDNWQGGMGSPKANPWLAEYCLRIGIDPDPDDSPIIQITDIRDQFAHHVKNIDKNTIKTGIQRLDKALPITIGMNLGIVGAASSGKTALALDILQNTSKNNVNSVFASLDMHRLRLMEKLLYKVSNKNREELYEIVNDEQQYGNLIDEVQKEFGNVWFYDRSAPTVADIRTYIERVQDKTGNKVSLLMLDYFERVNSSKSEDTAASKEIAGELQDLGNDLSLATITLVQPNKFSLSGGPDTPLLNYTAIKGSSFMYQSFRSIISIWRPFFNPASQKDDRFLQMAILKNDLGELGQFDFSWNGRRGEIAEMTSEQNDELKALLDKKKLAKGSATPGATNWT